MDIYEAFSEWLDNLLENDMPENTKAYNFNLYEESIEDHIYGIQVVATDRFDENDDEWACDEVWTSGEDIFCIDTSDEDDTSPQFALELITGLVREYLDGGEYADKLKSSLAVGIGFVDGDLDIIYKA